MIQQGEFHAHLSGEAAPSVTHLTISRKKMNGFFTSRTRGIQNSFSHSSYLNNKTSNLSVPSKLTLMNAHMSLFWTVAHTVKAQLQLLKQIEVRW